MEEYIKSGWRFRYMLFLVGACIWVTANWKILNGDYSFIHDSYYWFGIFHYFCESIQAGFFPLWNPYTHAGEPFFQYIIILALSDPISMLGTMCAYLFSIKDLFYLYEIIYLVRLIVISAGISLLLNKLLPESKTYSFFIFFVVLLSSFSINIYHQNGPLLAFGYLPYVLYFFLQFMERPTWPGTVSIGYFMGITCQSYHAILSGLYFLLFLIIYLISNREKLQILLQNKIKILAAVIIFLILSSPTWLFVLYQRDFFPYARVMLDPDRDTNVLITHDIEHLRKRYLPTGQFGDILSLGILPFGQSVFTDLFYEQHRSELAMFVGFIPFVFGLLGIFRASSKYKTLFIIMLILMFALFMGPMKYNFIYTILFYLVYPIRVIDTIQNFANFFMLTYFFFIQLGLQYIVSKRNEICSALKMRIRILERFFPFGVNPRLLIAVLFILTLIEFYMYINFMYKDERGKSEIEMGIPSVVYEQILLSDLPFYQRGYIDGLYEKKITGKKIYLAIILDKKFETVINNVLIDGYYAKRVISYYFFKNGVRFDDRFNALNILRNTGDYVVDPYSDGHFNLLPRSKSIMPRSWILTSNLNYISMMNKIQTAIDHSIDSPYDIIKPEHQNALTYPIMYADILKSKTAQGVKAALLGVGLQPYEFYTNHVWMDAASILEPRNAGKVQNLLRNCVILSENDVPEDRLNHEHHEAEVNILSYNPQHIILTVKGGTDGLLLFRDGYSSGWVARVDGIDKKVLRANYNQKAVMIEKGTHRVEFLYRPMPYIIVFRIYGIVNILIIVYLSVNLREIVKS